MTTITVKDFLEQLACASPDARMVFKIECEDKNFDARLEFSRVTCLSPATEVVVTMADNTEDVRTELETAEQEAYDSDRDFRELERDARDLINSARDEKLEAGDILSKLEKIL